MKIAILGFGREGKAVLKFLKKSPKYKKAQISILDKKISEDYLKNLADFNIVFRSPGVPYNLPQIRNAVKKGVKFSSATDLFFNEISKMVRHGSPQVIGVTGTKGKGTTSTLLYKILKAAKKDVYLAGNIGKPALEILARIKKNSVVILELSSFQLQDLQHSPGIAVVLNIFEDHMDSHKNFKEYAGSKSNIAKSQKKSGKIFYDADNKWSRWVAQKSTGKKIAVSMRYLKLFKPEDLRIKGGHNFKNAAIAATVAQHLGIKPEIIKKVVKNYRGMEHRLELTRCIAFQLRPRLKCNICFYNDSASTNPHTAAAAIHAFPNQPKILICGGKDKNLDYTPLAKALKNSNTKMLILFGENKEKINKAISKQKLAIKKVKNLNEAIDLAYKTAKSLVANYQLPVTILFSPASASFDMFKDYKERGKKFKELVKGLK
jgi:UDP-N-acetylmuramoylalanine--D-glutamate ligase